MASESPSALSGSTLWRRSFRESLAPVGVGMVGGLAGALILSGWLDTVLYGVTTTDPSTIAAAALLLLGTAIIAVLLPALRAAAISGTQALRAE